MDFDTEIKDFFLYCVRVGISKDMIAPRSRLSFFDNLDWSLLQDFASQQGLAAVVIDGLEKLPVGQRPPKQVLLQWIGEVLHGYEYRYELYKQTIAGLAAFYNQHGFKMMLLKGYACSLNWPKPEHRPCGDIDIWQFGQYKEADAALSKEMGIKVDYSHHHHTVFYWHNFMVENHYDFINISRHKSHVGLEALFKELGQDDSNYIELNGAKVFLPSPNHHALFLLRHSLNHFVSMGINLRQVLDWAFFVEKHTKEIDWEWFLSVLDEFHMRDFFNCLNAICIVDLGFSVDIFPQVELNPKMKESVLKDILTPEFTQNLPRCLFKRLIYLIRRWQGNAWKHKLCYNESRWSAFWSGIWAKLLKPTSI